jgi:hypothetical protein
VEDDRYERWGKGTGPLPFLDVWQAKDLQRALLYVWQGKELGKGRVTRVSSG